MGRNQANVARQVQLDGRHPGRTEHFEGVVLRRHFKCYGDFSSIDDCLDDVRAGFDSNKRGQIGGYSRPYVIKLPRFP